MPRETTAETLTVGDGKADPPGVVSFSQLNMVARCPQQYQYRYLEGRKEPPAFALGMGSAFHAAVEVQHEHKIETGDNLSESDMDDAFSDVWNQGMEFGGSRDEKNFISWKEVAKADGKLKPADAERKARAATREYHRKIAVKMDPVAVEAKLFVPFIDGRMFIAYIDCVEVGKEFSGGLTTAVDTKLVGRKYDPHAARSSWQLVSYAWAQSVAGGIDFDQSAFHVVTKTKEPGIQVLKHKVSKAQMNAFLQWAHLQLMIVDAGAFVGNVGQHCSWCGFNKECPWYNGRGFGSVPKSATPKLTPITFDTEPVPVKRPMAKKKVAKKKTRRKAK